VTPEGLAATIGLLAKVVIGGIMGDRWIRNQVLWLWLMAAWCSWAVDGGGGRVNDFAAEICQRSPVLLMTDTVGQGVLQNEALAIVA